MHWWWWRWWWCWGCKLMNASYASLSLITHNIIIIINNINCDFTFSSKNVFENISHENIFPQQRKRKLRWNHHVRNSSVAFDDNVSDQAFLIPFVLCCMSFGYLQHIPYLFRESQNMVEIRVGICFYQFQKYNFHPHLLHRCILVGICFVNSCAATWIYETSLFNGRNHIQLRTQNTHVNA